MSDFDGFKFQKFVVEHSKCAMKVGTDGVLLGAWVDVNDKKKVLDNRSYNSDSNSYKWINKLFYIKASI